MKNYAGKTTLFFHFLPIFAVFHYDLNIFLVMNSHTQIFFDFGMWGSKKSFDPVEGTSGQYESAVKSLAKFHDFNHNQSRRCVQQTQSASHNQKYLS